MSIIPPVHHTTPPPPVTSPGSDVCRPRLKQFARWIRDDLDVLVAREGPDALRADDVVMLHDLFVTLRHATAITALDLRATGIHKAVMAIAGVASRWPKRLCDDGDKIIALWTSKFGPLDEIYPFLYGRRGRLESIASQSEYSSEALLKRWSQQCAEKVNPSVSHRQGSLGFTAGDWWISSLFAHHAGIIGSESIEGGTTYDKDAAYALVLKNATGLDVWDEEFVTHRFSSNDKGRFRLTSATAKSRNPIRVLRNHSTNSILGPRAGIRYEGLYVVKGWTIRQAKLDDARSGRCKVGDIMYEVSLQRQDPVPMVEVTKRPNCEEVDDYMEYKRLRKHHRETNREEHGYTPPLPDVGPLLRRLQVSANPANPPRSLLRILPSIPRTNISRDLAVEGSKTTLGSYVIPPTSNVSPLGMSGQIHSFFPLGKVDDGSYFIKRGTIDVVTSPNRASVSDALGKKNARDARASIARSIADELKEILPWHELVEEPSTPTSLVLDHATD